MENIIESGSQPSNSSLHRSTVVEAQTVEINNDQQNVQPTAAVLPKKRKVVESRSPVWDHFEKIVDENNVTVEGKCIYCAKIYKCETKKHGTSSLRTHMFNCLKNPHSKDTRQSLLTFQAVTNSDASPATVGELGTWVFNQEAIRKALVEMIIIDELPFRFVEGPGFRKFILVCCPRFKIPSRWTISRDINLIYEEERLKLKCMFRGNTQRVSITTDTWISIQRINYMVVIAHFIDEEWRLNKKIISFVPVTSHKGESVAKSLENCLLDWGIRNVYTITVDNASSNDTALVVQDGLKQCDDSVKKVRDAVRYVRSSPARLKKFKDLSKWLGIEKKSSLCLDVPTRWNSTYLMLQSAVFYEKVFYSLEESDSSFKSDLGDSIPNFLDWESVKSLVNLLKCFYDMTIRISAGGSVKLMGETMKVKFEKYWGDIDKMNLMIFFANILDPRDKLEYMPAQILHMYGELKGKTYYEKVVAAFTELFDDYAASVVPIAPVIPSTVVPTVSVISFTDSSQSNVWNPQGLLKSQIKKQRMESGGKKKTELEIYLAEALVEEESSFDILRWWKLNAERFPILSKVARDVLAIPISTVASESAFSTSGRVLDPFRSSLTPKIVEALVCTQDWLRLPNTPISIEENLEELERFEQELGADGGSGAGRIGGSTLPTIPVMLCFILYTTLYSCINEEEEQ
ncbi:PREDICTED: zinc finger BED domain-containing protein RICESLEEPER 2-like [Ipomoea nil]|uniref:zinc finger BED domain-containing protein RICESLEEPER 2-like n=1 Tax=Ipomoea nil TaxID=35883 RepID=UPI00090141A6|nr:PREDICTED: zinc finger BED domain-containing protein RICESLEEPER 2-like [Ipomoea nil]